MTECVHVGVCHPRLIFRCFALCVWNSCLCSWLIPCTSVLQLFVAGFSSEWVTERGENTGHLYYSTYPWSGLAPSTSLEEQWSTMQTWLCLDSHLHPASVWSSPLINLPHPPAHQYISLFWWGVLVMCISVAHFHLCVCVCVCVRVCVICLVK